MILEAFQSHERVGVELGLLVGIKVHLLEPTQRRHPLTMTQTQSRSPLSNLFGSNCSSSLAGLASLG